MREHVRHVIQKRSINISCRYVFHAKIPFVLSVGIQKMYTKCRNENVTNLIIIISTVVKLVKYYLKKLPSLLINRKKIVYTEINITCVIATAVVVSFKISLINISMYFKNT